MLFSLSINGPGALHEVVVGVRDTDAKNVEPFRMKGETSQISWIMVARSDGNANKGSDSKYPIDQKPLVNLRTVEYRGTLNIGWVPDHGVEYFTLFVADLHAKWRRHLGDARHHQDTNVSPVFTYPGMGGKNNVSIKLLT